MSIARDLARLRTPVQAGYGGTGKTSTGAGAVGTVTQAAGIPTGAIIESGTTSVGNYTKYADGTLIAVVRNAGPWVVTVNAPTVIGPFSMGVTFTDANFAVFVTAAPTQSNDTFGVIASYASSQTSASFVFRNGATPQSISNIKMLAIGRWY